MFGIERECKLKMESRLANMSDLEGVLRLQQQYHISALSDSERADGFVTTSFSRQQLEDLVSREQGLFVAIDGDYVIDYLMTASWDYWSTWRVQAYMASIIDQYSFEGQSITLQNSYQYGPICIARAHRGSCLLESLFAFTLNVMSTRYSILVTFINILNPRSMNAHVNKLKLKNLGEFECNGNHHAWLAYSTTKQRKHFE